MVAKCFVDMSHHPQVPVPRAVKMSIPAKVYSQHLVGSQEDPSSRLLSANSMPKDNTKSSLSILLHGTTCFTVPFYLTLK